MLTPEGQENFSLRFGRARVQNDRLLELNRKLLRAIFAQTLRLASKCENMSAKNFESFEKSLAKFGEVAKLSLLTKIENFGKTLGLVSRCGNPECSLHNLRLWEIGFTVISPFRTTAG